MNSWQQWTYGRARARQGYSVSPRNRLAAARSTCVDVLARVRVRALCVYAPHFAGSVAVEEYVLKGALQSGLSFLLRLFSCRIQCILGPQLEHKQWGDAIGYHLPFFVHFLAMLFFFSGVAICLYQGHTRQAKVQDKMRAWRDECYWRGGTSRNNFSTTIVLSSARQQLISDSFKTETPLLRSCLK